MTTLHVPDEIRAKAERCHGHIVSCRRGDLSASLCLTTGRVIVLRGQAYGGQWSVDWGALAPDERQGLAAGLSRLAHYEVTP